MGSLYWRVYDANQVPTCLNPTDMQDNMDILLDIKQRYQNAYFPTQNGWQFVAATVDWQFRLNNGMVWAFHHGDMAFSKFICIPLPSGEVPRDE